MKIRPRSIDWLRKFDNILILGQDCLTGRVIFDKFALPVKQSCPRIKMLSNFRLQSIDLGLIFTMDHLILQKTASRIKKYPSRFICRGSNGVVSGALRGFPVRACCVRCCVRAFSIVFYSTWWYLPAKTHSKIDMSGNFLYFSWEWHQFMHPGASWSPGCLEEPSWVPQGVSLGSRDKKLYNWILIP